MTNDASAPDFLSRQRAFAAHIRDPARVPRPEDVNDRRMAIYRDLFYNNVEGFLSSGFPVLRSILADDHWHGIARDFFSRHRCETPLFAEISQEFLGYLHDERERDERDPPFMLELAHYEWVELAVSTSDADRDASRADPNGDLLRGAPMVSPVAWNLSYLFPVHRISPDFQPSEPGECPTHLVVYRDREDEIHFLEINPVTQRLLQLLKENPGTTGLDLLKTVAQELHSPDPDSVIRAGTELLADLKKRNILLGTSVA